MSDQIPDVANQPLWFIAYDVESENSKHLKPKERDWLRAYRVSIWYLLRHKYKCVPIQNSLWLIRQEQTKKELEKDKDRWLADYKARDFRALIEIFPIQTNEVGYKTFKGWEFEFILEWLGKIEKALIKANDVGKINKKSIQAHTKKIELLGNILHEDFDENFPNWKLAQDELGAIQDLLHQVQSAGATVTNI